jgi:polysaccharide export outer membrane protein
MTRILLAKNNKGFQGEETRASRGESMNGLRWIGISVFALIVVGCADMNESSEPVVNAGQPLANAEGDYRIGVDDRVQVTVWRNPELSGTMLVRPDGKISVPIIGDVEAGGRTPSELAENIKRQLSSYVRDPNVVVTVTELRSNEFLSRVRVTGAVRTPRSMPYRPGMTVLDAVLEAGSVNDFASPNRTRLYRRLKGKTEVFEIELGDILNKGRLETNLFLRPGDVITVPERLF